ncbi:MAG: glycosyltransferase family 2 protein, partial [Chloroflexota bacterium]|nr:glycosyltransferase family 2 protein [Chloroflexota bacterium]
MRLSVYVPCYNGARWIGECLDALIAQSQPVDEVLVVDDGSTDASATIVAGYAPRVRLVRHPRNLGLAVARNTALARTEGEIVASVDADVRATPTWMARLLDGFSSPRVVAVGGRLLEAHQEQLPDRWRAVHMAQHAGDLPLRNPPVLPGANVAVRRDVVHALGGYDETFRTNYEDADLQHRLQAQGYLCRYEPGAVAYHLRSDTASTVLRTYWGWLRPPFERRGVFLDGAGLEGKVRANADFAGRALWRDMAAADTDLSYLSLLVLLAFPGADFAHAALRAAERGEGDRTVPLIQAAVEWAHRAPSALVTRSAALAAQLTADLARIAWWDANAVGMFPRRDSAAGVTPPAHSGAASASALTAGVGSGFVERALAIVQQAVEAWPRAWWPAIEGARRRLAAEQGWSEESIAVSHGASRRTGDAGTAERNAGRGRGASFGWHADSDPAPSAGRWLARQAGADAQAVLLHGAHSRGEAVSGSPLEFLLVVRRALPASRVERLRAGLWERCGGVAVMLEVVQAHRLGWLRPSILQQSLLAGAIVLWGDADVLRVIPSWPPEALPSELALEEARGAAADLALSTPQEGSHIGKDVA